MIHHAAAEAAQDPTPAAIMRRDAAHLHTWLMRLDDASGVEGEWLPESAMSEKPPPS